jgi:predicted ATPase/class 3 adenylate cyclase
MSVKPICSACGFENDPEARFCMSCGTAIADRAPGKHEVRKVVTVVFSDVTGSTRLGQELDPESLKRMMSRHFDEMQSVLERHGGVVEKFIGDAVMAVFGVPRAHEDDALRAVRAAVEMRHALRRLNAEFDQRWGITVTTRTGINTGEVIAGDPGRGHAFVTGDAVNMAARLEQAANPGTILIGATTHRLVREAVVAEKVDPLAVKGKEEPLPAWMVHDVISGAPGWTRRLDSPLVGRERELAMLQDLLVRTAGDTAVILVTLIGPAGVGKSRLTEEFLARTGHRATRITGRCLPYGEGITFWPVVTLLRDAAGISERDSPVEVRGKLARHLPADSDGEIIADRLAALLGLGQATPGVQETFWAVRRLFEHLASQQPLVVVFDDIHWGEATFLDLLEYLADRIRGAPVLIVCLTRPELLELRAGWSTGRPNATTIALEPLTPWETEELIQSLIGGAALVTQARTRIADLAEGNPLFVEETLRMLVDDGLLRPLNGGWTVTGDFSNMTLPPTIHALLTARLDRLESEERAAIERASIVGRVFWWEAVAELSPEEARPRLAGHLQSLVRKELIRPDYSEIGTDAFRFTHILVRDAAYRAIPKSVRAELHERLADWIEVSARDRAGEYEEILGYHLEQAYRPLLDLGSLTEPMVALGRRAAGVLASAGRRAFGRGDMPAAANLLSRATVLLPEEEPERLELLPQLAFALMETGDFARLQDVVAETTEAATASGDQRLQAHAAVLELSLRLWTNPEGWAARAEAEAPRAISVFETVGDERGLAKAWSLLGLVHLSRARFGAAEHAWEEAAAHAHRAGDHRDELESLSWVPLTVWAGPTHVEQGVRRCKELLERVEGDNKAMSSALIAQAAFEAGVGHFEEARGLIARARSLLEEVALTVWLGGPLAQFAGWVELLADDPVAAEKELRFGYETLAEIGEMGWLSTLVAILAEALYLQGRYDEAEQLLETSEKSADAEDFYSQALWRSVRAKVMAQRRRADEAERLAGESVDIAQATDFLHLRWHSLMSQAEVLLVSGRTEDARPVADEAVRVAEQKGNIVGARRARDLIVRLDGKESGRGA